MTLLKQRGLPLNKVLAVLCLVFSVIFISACGKDEAKDTFLQANEALDSGEFQKADDLYSRVISQGKFLADSYRGKGIAQLNSGNYADAAISLSKAILNLQGENAQFTRDVEMYLAYCRQMQGNTEEAMDLYEKLIEEEPDADLLYQRGRIHMAAGEYKKADEDFTRAAELSSDYNLYISIYEIYASYRKGANGSEFLEKAMSKIDVSEGDNYSRGLIYYYLQDYDSARSELITALRNDDDNEKVMLLLGKTYLAMGDVADARAMYKEHIEDESHAAAAYNGMALCDMADENYSAALENIKKGLGFGDEEANKSLLFNEILIYEHFEDWDNARDLAAQYVKSYPLEEEGLREYQFLSTR